MKRLEDSCVRRVLCPDCGRTRRRSPHARSRMSYTILADGSVVGRCRSCIARQRVLSPETRAKISAHSRWRKVPSDVRRRNAGIIGPGMISYDDYLLTTYWNYRRKGALHRAGYRCQACGTYDGTTVLVVHHNNYDRLGCESPLDLCVLCRVCHNAYHESCSLAPRPPRQFRVERKMQLLS